MPAVLSIGTTHPRNVAGIGRDAIVGTDLGCRVLSVVAAVSAQDEAGARVFAIPEQIVRAQLHTLPDAAAIRVGALGSAANAGVVAETIRSRGVAAVVDPVRATSDGAPLADDETWSAVCASLATLSHVILTPNLDEAAAILGVPHVARAEMEEAAAALRARGAGAVLLKGGHLEGDPVDVLATDAAIERFEGVRIAARMRGTGCTLAMAIACGLAHGRTLRDAVSDARAYVRAKMTASLRE